VGQAGSNSWITQAGKEKFREKEKNKWAAREFWAALRKRKRFSNFDSRNDIQIQILNISKPNLNWIFKIR
jgi:hypothetical protein